MKQAFGLILFITLILMSNKVLAQTKKDVHLTELTEQGHQLDCVNYCNTCITTTKFDALFNAFAKVQLAAKKPVLIDAAIDYSLKEIKKEIENKDKPKRRSNKYEVGTEAYKLEEEMLKQEEIIDKEVNEAVEKVLVSTNANDDAKVKEVANRIRTKLTDKRRKETAKNLGINLNELDKRLGSKSTSSSKVNMKSAPITPVPIYSPKGALIQIRAFNPKAYTGRKYLKFYNLCVTTEDSSRLYFSVTTPNNNPSIYEKTYKPVLS